MTTHPIWCAQGHLCSASRGGEHRSEPLTILTDYGALVVTRTRTAAGRDRLEVRTVIALDTHELPVRTAALAVLAGIDAATREALAGHPRRTA